MTDYIELTHTGEILKTEFIEPYNLSQNALAKAINVPPNRIHQIVKGDRRITADTDLRLTKFFGLTDGYFIRFQNDYEKRKVKREIAEQLDKIVPINSNNKPDETRASL